MRRSATSGLITKARLKIYINGDRFWNKRRLENATSIQSCLQWYPWLWSARRYPKKKVRMKLDSTVTGSQRLGWYSSSIPEDGVQECSKVKILDKSRQEWHDVLRGYTDYVSLCSPVHHESCQDVPEQISINWFLDWNATVNQERSVIRFQMRSTSVYPDSHVLKLQKEPRMEYMKMLEIKKNVEK